MTVRIPLPCGKEALISDGDAFLANEDWRLVQGYVLMKEKIPNPGGPPRYRIHRLHRKVIPCKGKHVYFKDGDPLNCQRENLTTEYVCRPGNVAGRRAGDPTNDGGWATRRAREGQNNHDGEP